MIELHSIKNTALRTLVDFLIMLIILCSVAYFAYNKIDALLKSSLEESVALTAKSISVGLDSQLTEKVMKLNSIAFNLENGVLHYDMLNQVFLHKIIGEKLGIVLENNEAVFGDPLPQVIFDRCNSVFNGERFITYQKDYGLVFAVPLKIDGKNCILYNSMSNGTIRKAFHTNSYNGSSTIILIDTSNLRDDWIILNDGDEVINTEAEMEPNWGTLIEKAKSEENLDSWAIYAKFKDKGYFLYAAEVSKKYNIVVTGYAAWNKVAVGIDYI